MSRRYQPLSSNHAQTIKAHASRMRKSPTPSEAALWAVLCSGKLGVAFRRQFVIGRFVADFAALAARLIVDTDGGYHSRRGSADASRDRKLQRLGWRVLRLPARVVLLDIELAKALVHKHLSNM